MPVSIASHFYLSLQTGILINKNNYFDTTNLVYAQPDQINSNITNSVNIQNMQVKKVHAGDIDIAYKYDTSPQITR